MSVRLVVMHNVSAGVASGDKDCDYLYVYYCGSALKLIQQ